MKITKSKSTLTLKVQMVISEGNCPIPETVNFTRMQRAGSSRVHKLTPEMPAPAKPPILTKSKNKIQLNAMLVEGLPAYGKVTESCISMAECRVKTKCCTPSGTYELKPLLTHINHQKGCTTFPPVLQLFMLKHTRKADSL